MACDEYVEEMALRSVTKILKKLAEKPAPLLTLRRRIKSHLLFAGIIRSSPFSPR